MKKFVSMSVEGAFPNAIDQYLEELVTLIRENQAQVAVLLLATDYFTIPDKKDGLNWILDSVRGMGVSTVLILNTDVAFQDLSGIRADCVELINFHLWRCYNEIFNKKSSGVNNNWNSTADRFLFLTGKPDRQHRARLLWKFEQADLLDRCCWSFWSAPDQVDELAKLLPEIADVNLASKLQSWHRNPDSIEVKRYGTMYHYCGIPYDARLFSNTKFRVISESIFGNIIPALPSVHFSTEKTYITLFNKVPWIMAAQPGILASLRSRGYETFDEHLVEPYDLVLDSELRLDSIVRNTQQWMQEIPDTHVVMQKIEHNYQCALTQARANEALLENLIKQFGIDATPEQIVPTVDK